MSPKGTSPDEQSSRKLEKKLIALFVFPFIVFAAISCWEGLNDQQIAELLEIFNFSKFGAPINGALITFLLLLFGLFAFSPSIRWIQKSLSALTGKYFVISLAALAVLGAAAALYTPSYTNLFKPDTQQSTSSTQNAQGSGNQQNQSSKDPSSDLRLHLLYITGGIIAVLGLIETNRKNSQDHIREVHAARRDRYIEAVDKLSSEQAPVRLGGVYALVGLVDEWLDDDNIDEETRIKEGQIIINNLCAYIRSPFLTAEQIEVFEVHQRLKAVEKFEAQLLPYKVPPHHQAQTKRYKHFIDTNIHKEPEDIAAEYAKLYEEQDIRRAIFTMMSSRVNRFDKKQGKSIPGPWSGFDFNFRNSKIFYPLNDINIESPDFNGAIFIINANFQGSYFSGKVSLIDATFRAKAEFSRAIFNSELDKENSEIVGAPERFEEKIITSSTFYKTIFEQEASFTDSIFLQCPEFMNTKFMNGADFTDSLFNFNTAKNLRLHSRDMSAGQTSMQSDSPEGFILPRRARLFDPGSWDEEKQEYIRVSDPAEPLENSDTEEEKPTE